MEKYILDRIKKYIDTNKNNDKLLYLFTPPGYGKSVKIPMYLSTELRILVVETNELYVEYFRIRNSEVAYISVDVLWNTIIENYDKNKCKLNLDYDLVIFDDYTDENLEMIVLIKLLQRCNFKNVMIQNSNAKPLVWELDEIRVPFKPFHTDIRYFDMNYEYDDRKLLKDMARLINDFDNSTIEGNFLVILPKSFMVNALYPMIKGLAFKFTHYDSLSSLNLFMKDTDKIEEQRKIIIITDTLEPLLSISRLGLIIETGFESQYQNTLTGGKRKVVVPITYERLSKYCSRLNVKFPGICFRMFTKDRIETKKNIKTVTGLFWYQILQLKSKGLDEFLIKTPVIDASFETIKILNICNDYKEPSCVFAHHSNLGIRNSLVLFQYLKSSEITQIVILLCFIDNYDSYFYRFVTKTKNEQDTEFTLRLLKQKQDLLLRFAGLNDIDTFINIWNDNLEKVKNPWESSESPIFITNQKWFLLLKMIKNTFDVLSNQYKIKISSNYKIDVKMDQFKKRLAACYEDKILSLDSDNNYYIDKDDKKYRLDQKFSLNMLSSKLPKSIISLVDMNVKLEGGLGFVLLAVDV